MKTINRLCVIVVSVCLCAGLIFRLSCVPVYAAAETTLTFDANGGTASEETKTVTYKKKYGALPSASRTGYSFKGWYTKRSKGTKVSSKTVCKNKKPKTLYAHWTVNTFSISYNNGAYFNGSGSVKSQTGVKYTTSKTLNANAYKLSGYSFAGWAVSQDGPILYQNKQKVRGLSAKKGGKVKLYAKWRGNTSSNSPYSKYYTAYKKGSDNWSKFKSSAALVTGSTVIPGLVAANIGDNIVCTSMVPQGVCMVGSYQLVTAYDYTGNNNSVIYVSDIADGSYKVTIRLGTKCHVGAVCYDAEDDMVCVADSDAKAVLSFPASVIDAAVSQAAETGQDCYLLADDDVTALAVEINPSFISWYEGKLLVGNFDSVKNANNHMYAYAKNAQDSFVRMGEIDISLPLKCQGVAFVDYADETYLICSSSYGRTNASKMYVYKLIRTDDERWIEFALNSDNKRIGITSGVTFPNMAEDICWDGAGSFYVAFESGSTIYQYNYDRSGVMKRGSEIFPLDRITANSVARLIAMIKNDDSTKLTEEYAELAAETVEEELVELVTEDGDSEDGTVPIADGKSDDGRKIDEFVYISTVEPTCGSHGFDIYANGRGEIEYRNMKEQTDRHHFECIGRDSRLKTAEYRCRDCGAYYATER